MFETPNALWLLLALPIIVALWLLQPRRPRVRIGSVLLWPPSPAQRQAAKPWQRLRNHPLLWLQLLAALALAVGAARPFQPANAAAQHRIVLLDASGAMRAQDAPPTRFEVARALVVELARDLGPGQTLTVIRVDDRPTVLVNQATTTGQVERALVDQTPGLGQPDTATALALAVGLTQGAAEWIGVGAALRQPGQFTRPDGVTFRAAPVGSSTANVAVTGLATRASDSGVIVQAGVRNTGRQPVAGRLQLLAEGELIGAREWSLPPGAETHLTWSGLPAGAAWYEARLSGVDARQNALSTDDQAWAAGPAAGGPRAAPGVGGIVLVSAGNTYIERALTVQGDTQLFRVAPTDLATLGDIARYPLTVLDRTWPETEFRGAYLALAPPLGAQFRPRGVWPNAEHPLMRHVDWSEVRVGVAVHLELGPDWETVVDSDGGPLLAIRSAAGKRQAILAIDLTQTDLPLRPAFPVLMANLLDWLLPRPDAPPRAVPPGGRLNIEPAALTESIAVETVAPARDPASPEELAPPWPARAFHAAEPGLYRLVQRGEGWEQAGYVVVNGYDPQIADIEPRVDNLIGSGGPGEAPNQGPLEWWPWIAAAALLIALIEWWGDARG